jgi:hypothetical protein
MKRETPLAAAGCTEEDTREGYVRATLCKEEMALDAASLPPCRDAIESIVPERRSESDRWAKIIVALPDADIGSCRTSSTSLFGSRGVEAVAANT